MSFQMTSFEEILNYFKLRNCWLNSKLCATRKLSHSDVNTCVFFVKNESLKFVIDEDCNTNNRTQKRYKMTRSQITTSNTHTTTVTLSTGQKRNY